MAMQVGIQDGVSSHWLLGCLLGHGLILVRAALPCSQSCYLSSSSLSMQELLALVLIELQADLIAKKACLT